MIFKWLILIGIVYVAYKLFSGQPLLNKRPTKQIPEQEPDEEGFIDFEEID